MKKIVLSLTMLLATGLSGFAYDYDITVEDENGNTLYFTIQSVTDFTAVLSKADIVNTKERVVIPDSVKYGSHAFAVLWISRGAFENQKNASIVLPKILKSMSGRAFNGATHLQVYVPDLETWCNIIRYDTPEKMVVEKLYINDKLVTDLVIPETITKMQSNAFRNCKSITSVTLPKTIDMIDEGMFAGCSRLQTVKLPDNVTAIGKEAFYDCKNLTTINFPSSLKEIGRAAFQECPNLTGIDLSHIEKLSPYSFYLCSSLDSICLTSATGVSEKCFYGCGLKSVTLGDNITFIGPGAFCSSRFSEIQIPISTISIGEDAFNNCWLRKVVIPDFVTNLGKGAFACCSHLDSVIIGDGIYKISENAFKLCDSLSFVHIGNATEEIESFAFWDDINLKTVVLGKNLKKFYSSSFMNCKNIREITVYAEQPPKFGYFDNIVHLEATVSVPAGTEEAYRNSENWGKFLCLAEGGQTDYSVSVTAGKGGTVAIGKESVNNGKMTVTCAEGDDVVLTITADKGYKISAVKVDGTDVTKDVKDGKYTLEDVDEDTSITVAFEAMVYERDDVNEDGEVNTADVTHIYNRIIYGKNNEE